MGQNANQCVLTGVYLPVQVQKEKHQMVTKFDHTMLHIRFQEMPLMYFSRIIHANITRWLHYETENITNLDLVVYFCSVYKWQRGIKNEQWCYYVELVKIF